MVDWIPTDLPAPTLQCFAAGFDVFADEVALGSAFAGAVVGRVGHPRESIQKTCLPRIVGKATVAHGETDW